MTNDDPTATVALILGTAQLRGTYGVVGRPVIPRSDREADALLRRAVGLGFTAVDTAPAYDDAETIIGRSRLDLAVHTKIDPGLEPAASLERSLLRLERSRVEILHFHDPEIVSHDPRALVEQASQLVGEQVGALGASVYGAPELRAVIEDGRFGAVQIPLSLLDRRIDDLQLLRASERGLQVIVRSVFLQGLLLTPAELIPDHLAPLAPYIASVHAVAQDAELSVPAVALGWVKSRPGTTGIVVGANSEHELMALAEAWAAPRLGDDVLAACASLPAPPPEWCDPRTWAS